MTDNWWETIDTYQSDSIIPTVHFIIRCKECGSEYETSTLQYMLPECPECGKKSEVCDD